ncbi:MAG: formylglycine-generating enzyme family protein [Nitrospirales bacterium]
MLETRFKVAILLAVLFFTSLPLIGILNGPSKGPSDSQSTPGGSPSKAADVWAEGVPPGVVPVAEELIRIPAGPFLQGTESGGYDEHPERSVYLDEYFIDRYEVTNYQYQQFALATGHRKPGPPSRYAKNMELLRGVNQPVTYVSWYDAEAYCQWKGRRLPTEAEWEKAMRGTDGRLWPWGNQPSLVAANWAHDEDAYTFTAPDGTFRKDLSPFGVADGAGNIMEWVQDLYAEDAYKTTSDTNPMGPDHGTYKVLRGGGYTSQGKDIRITSRSRMVPEFRDESLGFRCASTVGPEGEAVRASDGLEPTGNQSNRE